MLRYIYLLCFIIGLEGVFCYEYIDEQPDFRRERHRVNAQARDGVHSRLRKREDYEFDDRPLTQIDVSSFIQAPDELQELEPANYDSKSRRKPISRYEEPYLGPFAPPAPRRPRGHRRALQTDLNNAITDPTSSYQQQLLINRHLIRNPKKKCALTKVFPFFSHKKADAAQKKDKNKDSKKKLFHLGSCSKKAEQNKDSLEVAKNLDLVHQKQKSKEQSSYEPRIEKRYAELICPKCKETFLMQKERRNANDIFHNSRQYFASLQHAKGNVETSTKKYGSHTINNVFDDETVIRRKRRKTRRFGKVVRKK